jgi:hypothetical protein
MHDLSADIALFIAQHCIPGTVRQATAETLAATQCQNRTQFIISSRSFLLHGRGAEKLPH